MSDSRTRDRDIYGIEGCTHLAVLPSRHPIPPLPLGLIKLFLIILPGFLVHLVLQDETLRGVDAHGLRGRRPSLVPDHRALPDPLGGVARPSPLDGPVGRAPGDPAALEGFAGGVDEPPYPVECDVLRVDDGDEEPVVDAAHLDAPVLLEDEGAGNEALCDESAK